MRNDVTLRILFAPYGAAVWTLALFGAVWKGLGILTGNNSINDLRERLGLDKHRSPAQGQTLVINAVSVGEMAEAESLIVSLVRLLPDAQFVITTGNRDGRVRAEKIRERFGPRITVTFRPWDLKGPIKRWLRRVKPVAFVTLETDIWPNLFRACNELEIPVLIVNGRVYGRDVWKYRLARPSFRRLFSCVEWIGAQSREDAQRFLSIGADPSRIDVVGNIKLDQDLLSHRPEDPRLRLLSKFNGLLLVGGSTHAPEEALILEAYAGLHASHPEWRLVLAPRHVRRSESVEQLAAAKGLATCRWSSLREETNSWEVLVVDQIGWLPWIYDCSQLVVLGGTMSRHGGHNPAEAAIHGSCLMVGPHCTNFEDAIAGLEAARGLVRITVDDFRQKLGEILSHDTNRAETGRAARRFVLNHRGLADRYASEVMRRVSPGPNRTVQTAGPLMTAGRS